jgi:yecA family protein
MDISTLDGFLTAIVCGPKTIMPSEWIRWVWDMENGEDALEFKDQAQAQRNSMDIHHVSLVSHGKQADHAYERGPADR